MVVTITPVKGSRANT